MQGSSSDEAQAEYYIKAEYGESGLRFYHARKKQSFADALAEAQALADVRALDARAERIGKPVAPCPDGDGRWFIADAGTVFTGATPDEARHEAAEWVRRQAATTTQAIK